ncbi:MFS transporter [Cohnella lubricantis]|uniref:MFS transporter n=1 Tax=Cohnella lubricantis TaxID=2163172 RepID=A0A841TEA2_9BACL|nr:MFS transporter [Cohnella lubricantis]MBB6679614.1 MFS transporter [Cohnella lubricantis]MBP2120666.1 putative MFS family arabinose efflux permease [Cohnella lubricantis]
MNFRIILLALGIFAVNMEGLMIAGILPSIANQFQVSVSEAGLLVTFFSLVYAIGSPILTTVLGQVEKRKLLVGSLIAFTVGNIICSLSTAYEWMLVGRIIAAIGAGAFSPAATATAASLVSPEKRGRAISIVVAGQTVAMIVGVPIGIWLAISYNWQILFWIVAAAALLASLLIRLLFPVLPSTSFVSLKVRMAIMKRSEILLALFTTLSWGIGIFSVYTYIAEIFIGLGAVGKTVSIVFLIAGIANFIGVSLGGYSVDRIGSPRTITLSLPILGIALALFSVVSTMPPFKGALEVGFAAAVLWGISTYMFNPAQQHRLTTMSGQAAGIALSLHASFVYLGSALGAILGGLVIQYGAVAYIGYFGGGWILIALLVFGASMRVASTRQQANEASG